MGDGLSRESCENLVAKYGLNNVKFYGYHPVDEMPKYYALADAFAITMVDNEVVNSTLPAKVQSYMPAGKPIIGAISGEVKEVIKEAKCGYCTDSGNVSELAKIIENVYNQKEELDQLGKNGYLYYKENFDKDVCISNLEKIFEEEIERS